jgi:phosphate transport system substrate-binding protein
VEAENANGVVEEVFHDILTDKPEKDSWQTTAATFILMHKVQEKPENAKAALKFFSWAYNNGAKAALSLDYIPMPKSVVKQVEESWKNIKDTSGKSIY